MLVQIAPFFVSFYIIRNYFSILSKKHKQKKSTETFSSRNLSTSFLYANTTFRHKKSTRRDSNPRPSPWQGDTPPLSHSCMLFSCLCSLEQYILYRIKRDLSTEKLKKFIFFNFSVISHQLRTRYSRNGVEGELDK